MALNPYLSHKVTSEQDLYADLIIESIKAYGEDVYYLPRDVVNVDTVLNEDVESRFDSSYMVEMYIENTEGFEGEGNLLAKFGLEIRDEATFVVAKRTWNSLVGDLENQARPMEGDLIYLPLSKSLFEISFVEHEQPFYQLSNLPIYKLQARIFEYSDEEFDTGVQEIDQAIEQKFAFITGLTLSSVVGQFEYAERVQQEIVDTGEYISAEIVSLDGNVLNVTNIETTDNEFHEFVAGKVITGLNTGATGMIASPTDIQVFANTNTATTVTSEPTTSTTQNYTVEYEADSIIDFSESNPFGEID
jgi:hypothetical protein